MFRRVFPLALVLACIAAPRAHAEQLVWDFTMTGAPQPIVQGLTSVTMTAQGLHIQTTKDGSIAWQSGLPAHIGTLTLTVTNTTMTEADLLWKTPGIQGLSQLPFTIEPGTTHTVTLDPTTQPDWKAATDAIGIGFPTGTDITLQRIVWQTESPFEKLIEPVRSFWTFDTISPYSINFLWGPLLAFSSAQRATLLFIKEAKRKL